MHSYGGYGKKKAKANKKPAGAARAVANAIAPNGYHRMPDGELMKGSTHKRGK